MEVRQLFSIYLFIVVSCFGGYAHTKKRSDIVQQDKFTISGTGSTNGAETKIDLHVETTDKNLPTGTSQSLSKQPSIKPVAAAKQGQAAPQVSPSQPKLPGQKSISNPPSQVGPTKGSLAGQSAPNKPNVTGTIVPGIVPSKSVTIKPTLSSQVASPSLSPPKKGKSFQVTPKPAKTNQPIGQNPMKKPLAATPGVNIPAASKASNANSLPSPATNKAASPNAKLPLPTPTPSATLKPSSGRPVASPAPGANAASPAAQSAHKPSPSKAAQAISHSSPVTPNVASPGVNAAAPTAQNANKPTPSKVMKVANHLSPVPKKPSHGGTSVPPVAAPSANAASPTHNVNKPTPSMASKTKTHPTPVASKPSPSVNAVPLVATPSANAATSTPLAKSSKITPTKISQNKQATSSLPTPPLSAQKAPSSVAKPPPSKTAAPQALITPSVTQAAIAPTSSSKVSVAPSSSPPTTGPEASTIPSASAPQFTFSRGENTSLAEHNFLRVRHESVPVKLNKNMVLEARQFAQKLAAQGHLTHESPDVLNKLGQAENLGMVCSKGDEPVSPNRAILKVIDAWYEEACKNSFDEPSKRTAHFTQLVWNGTTELGIGIAESKTAKEHCVYVVARYKPKGNIEDREQFKSNVKKGMFDPSLDCSVKTMKRFRIG